MYATVPKLKPIIFLLYFLLILSNLVFILLILVACCIMFLLNWQVSERGTPSFAHQGFRFLCRNYSSNVSANISVCYTELFTDIKFSLFQDLFPSSKF